MICITHHTAGRLIMAEKTSGIPCPKEPLEVMQPGRGSAGQTLQGFFRQDEPPRIMERNAGAHEHTSNLEFALMPVYYSLTMNKHIDCIPVGDLQTNCWLYAPEDEGGGQAACVVIDPGDNAGLIVSRLQELNWVPHYILLTHGHLDHVAALPDLMEACGKAFGTLPKIGINRLDDCYLGKDSLKVHRDSFSSSGGDVAFVDALWKPMPDADLFFEEGDSIGPFRVLQLPGHTPGSVGFYDEKAGVLFSGDTLFRGT